MNKTKKIVWISFFLCASLWGAPLNDNGNGTVTDSATGLVWQKCSAGLGTTLGNCNTGNPTKYNWSNAISYCEGLTLGGRSDWRLPNINELRSIIDYTFKLPAIDSIAFPNTQSDTYWSSTFCYSVDFDIGNVSLQFYNTNPYYVRCVTGL